MRRPEQAPVTGPDSGIREQRRRQEVRVNPQYRQYQYVRKPTLGLLYLGFNTQMKPFDDRRVRQAFNYAVNKEAIVREITRMGSILATGALPWGMLGYDPELQGYAYDPATAKRDRNRAPVEHEPASSRIEGGAADSDGPYRPITL